MNQSCALPSFQNQFKVSVIGAGNVGATAAYAMLLDGTPSELAIVDYSKEKAEGLLLDFEHSLPFVPYTKLRAGSDYSLAKDSHLIVVTAGARQADGETRLQLIEKNREIFKSIIPKLAEVAPNAILLIISNPADVLTYEAYKLSGFPRNRVFGSGTMLDTARFRFHISESLCLSPKSIEAYVLGEHGDSSFPVWSSANVAGKGLFDFPGFTKEVADSCFEKTQTAAARIIHDMGFTCYSIGTVIRDIMLHIFDHSRIVLPLSVITEGEYGLSDVALSLPCVLDSTGIAEVLEVPMNEKEMAQLQKSAEILKEYLK